MFNADGLSFTRSSSSLAHFYANEYMLQFLIKFIIAVLCLTRLYSFFHVLNQENMFFLTRKFFFFLVKIMSKEIRTNVWSVSVKEQFYKVYNLSVKKTILRGLSNLSRTVKFNCNIFAQTTFSEPIYENCRKPITQ